MGSSFVPHAAVTWDLECQVHAKDDQAVPVHLWSTLSTWMETDMQSPVTLRGTLLNEMNTLLTHPHTLYTQKHRLCLVDTCKQWGRYAWTQMVADMKWTDVAPTWTDVSRVVVPIQSGHTKKAAHAESSLGYWVILFLLPFWLKDPTHTPAQLELASSDICWTSHAPNVLSIRVGYLRDQWTSIQVFLQKLDPFVDGSKGISLHLRDLNPSPKRTASWYQALTHGELQLLFTYQCLDQVTLK
jgi:hypothetical protein